MGSPFSSSALSGESARPITTSIFMGKNRLAPFTFAFRPPPSPVADATFIFFCVCFARKKEMRFIFSSLKSWVYVYFLF